MDNPKVIIRKDGRVTVNGAQTAFYVSCHPFPGQGSRHYWYIHSAGYCFKSAALFRTKGKLRQAIATFIEGGSGDVNRAIHLCAETGSTHRIPLC